MRAISKTGRVLTVLALLALPAGAFAQQAAPPAVPIAFLVVPGFGIGQWTLDGKLVDYVFVMGDTQVAENSPSGTELVFRRQLWEKSWSSTPRIFVLFPPTSNVIWAVGTNDPAARTIDKVGVGSTESQLVAAYQDPQTAFEMPLRTRTVIYNDRGIAFEFEYIPAIGRYSPAAGRVFVFRPGQARAIWPLP